MGELQLKESLPYTWRDPETCRNDQRWLGGIIRNAAPFSDWWTKTRIVQLAYQPMSNTDPQIYRGLASVGEIVKALYQELEAHCKAQGLSECQKYYPGFFNAVDEELVITTLPITITPN
jgi:nitric oxide synthase oxygenase domain/subunit